MDRLCALLVEKEGIRMKTNFEQKAHWTFFGSKSKKKLFIYWQCNIWENVLWGQDHLLGLWGMAGLPPTTVEVCFIYLVIYLGGGMVNKFYCVQASLYSVQLYIQFHLLISIGNLIRETAKLAQYKQENFWGYGLQASQLKIWRITTHVESSSSNLASINSA